jgi:hypothetical protein
MMHAGKLAWISLVLGLLWMSPAMAIEQPKYKIVLSEGAFELRHYAPRLIAETVVEGSMDEASNKGFRLIANFIFGDNQVNGSQGPSAAQTSSIAMTTPVTIEPQSSKIAMTAPVTLEPASLEGNMEKAHQWRIYFVMPSQYTLESIPKPQNHAVHLRELPSQFLVVYQFSGLNTLSRVQRKTDEALKWARQKSFTVRASPQFARYNPPWTLPMFRRNEIMLEVFPPAGEH